MSNLVIVAIPDENDRVWKVSSEKVPHLTLLYLGDADQVGNVEDIVQFVEHAADTSLKRFYLSVDRRDTLGADDADVLFFRTKGYDIRAVREFRALLLKDNNIKSAHDATSQFELPPETGAAGQPWIPHLTLGYPTSPANKMPDDWSPQFYDVSFNKIAVWMGDFEGPEFLLKDYWDEYEALESVPMGVSMSAIRAQPIERDETAARGAEFLAHYGVKGMKWGVKKDPKTGLTPGETKREGAQSFFDPQGHALSSDVAKVGIGVLLPIVAPLTWPAQIRMIRGGARGVQKKALDREEKKFAKNAMSPTNFAAIHNGAIGKANREIGKLDAKYPDLSKPATKKKYDDAVVKAMQDAYRESANSLVNKSNTVHLDVSFHGDDGQDVRIHAAQGPGTPIPERVKHAAEDDLENAEIIVEITGKVKRNATGHVVGFDLDGFKSNTAAHAVDIGATLVNDILSDENALAHYGVKGMQWGVRRNRETPTAVTPSATSRVPHGTKRKTKIETAGGENHPAHEDAIKVAQARTKLSKSGAAALSNNELREVANRLQLEQQVKQLTTSGGKKFVTGLLRNEGQQGSQQLLRKGVKKGGRGARKVALGF